MAFELEVKFHPVELDQVRERCRLAGGEKLSCYFEHNEVFDIANRALRSQDILLRLRFDRGKRSQAAKLTLKLPSHDVPMDSEVQDIVVAQAKVKVREEYEVAVGDAGAVTAVLAALGYIVAFRYEKIRETWRLGEVFVCLDRLPFGNFVELEGPLSGLSMVVDVLGFDWQTATTATYYSLHSDYRRRAGLALDENFIFAAESPWLE